MITKPVSFSDCARVAMELLHTINTSQIGYGSVLEGPYGTRRGEGVDGGHINEPSLRLVYLPYSCVH